MLTPEDHTRVHAAIAAAEAKTAGELFCIVARESASYREVPLAWAAIAAFALPPLVLLAGLRPAALLASLQGGWVIPRPGAIEDALATGVAAYAATQVLLFVVVLLLVAIPAVRRRLTPGFVASGHVHARATELFAHRRHSSGAPASILIYASRAERRVEIVAGDDIHAKVGDGPWKAAVAAATAKIRAGDAAGGLIAAVEICGAALAAHFPPDGAPRPQPADDVSEV